MSWNDLSTGGKIFVVVFYLGFFSFTGWMVYTICQEEDAKKAQQKIHLIEKKENNREH